MLCLSLDEELTTFSSRRMDGTWSAKAWLEIWRELIAFSLIIASFLAFQITYQRNITYNLTSILWLHGRVKDTKSLPITCVRKRKEKNIYNQEKRCFEGFKTCLVPALSESVWIVPSNVEKCNLLKYLRFGLIIEKIRVYFLFYKSKNKYDLVKTYRGVSLTNFQSHV